MSSYPLTSDVASTISTLSTRGSLEAIVGVDAESQDGRNAHGLIVAHGGLEFPTPQGREDFCGHVGRAGLQDAHVFDIS